MPATAGSLQKQTLRSLYPDFYMHMTHPVVVFKRIMDNNTSQNALVYRYTCIAIYALETAPNDL